MEHETYLATAAQLLPVFVIAGMLELHQFVKVTDRMGHFESRNWYSRFLAHFWLRLLAACTFACLVLSLECLEALYTEDEPGWLHPILQWVLPISAVTIALPVLGAVVRPRALLSWYEESPPAKQTKKKHDD